MFKPKAALRLDHDTVQVRVENSSACLPLLRLEGIVLFGAWRRQPDR